MLQQTTGSDIFNSGVYFTRSFVQFAGFTGGRAVSFFDLISFDPYGLANIRPNLGNTGATGINVFAYTWQLGNGASFTVSAEDACAAYPTALGLSGVQHQRFGEQYDLYRPEHADRGCLVVNNTRAPASLAPTRSVSAPRRMPTAATTFLTSSRRPASTRLGVPLR